MQKTKEGQFKFDWLIVLGLIFLAVALRAWPDIKAGYWPIGYDTFNSYVPDLLKFDGNFWRWITSANLLYFLIWPFEHFLKLDPNLLIKIAGATLYGGLAMVFYIFCRKFMKWSWILAFLATVLLVIQIPALRLSWDLLRNVLGLIFFLPAFYFLSQRNTWKSLVWLGIFSVLVVLSNQLVAGLWLVILIIWLAKNLIQKKYTALWQTALAILPALVMLFITFTHSSSNTFNNHVFYLNTENRLFNYVDVYKNKILYQDLSHIVTSLFCLCYQFILPLALLGFWLMRKNFFLVTLTLWLLLGTFSALLFGGYGLFVWDRWMIMLVIPFTLYAIVSLEKIGGWILTWKVFQPGYWQISLKILGLGLALSYLAVIFLYSWPFINTTYDKTAKPFVDPAINAYFPPTMIHNAVGYKNLRSVLAAVNYLDRKAPSGAIIMIDNRYRGIVLTKMDYRHRFVYSYPWTADLNQKALEDLREKDLGPIFTIWSSQDNQTGFDRVFYSGLVAVYRDKKTYQNFLDRLEERP